MNLFRDRMSDSDLREIFLHNIDDQDKKKRAWEEERDELQAAFRRYQEAYDEFKKTMDEEIEKGHDIHLALSTLLQEEAVLGRRAEKLASDPEEEQRIATYMDTLRLIEKKYKDMQEKEHFGDIIQEDMSDSLRKLTEQIEEADSMIVYLVQRLFNESEFHGKPN